MNQVKLEVAEAKLDLTKHIYFIKDQEISTIWQLMAAVSDVSIVTISYLLIMRRVAALSRA